MEALLASVVVSGNEQPGGVCSLCCRKSRHIITLPCTHRFCWGCFATEMLPKCTSCVVCGTPTGLDPARSSARHPPQCLARPLIGCKFAVCHAPNAVPARLIPGDCWSNTRRLQFVCCGVGLCRCHRVCCGVGQWASALVGFRCVVCCGVCPLLWVVVVFAVAAVCAGRSWLVWEVRLCPCLSVCIGVYCARSPLVVLRPRVTPPPCLG